MDSAVAISFLFFLFLIAVFAISTMEFFDVRAAKAERRYREKGVRIKGVVRRVDHNNAGRGADWWEINAKYEIDGVGYYVGCKVFRQPAHQPGDAINVWYMPDDPNDSIIMKRDAVSGAGEI